MDLQGYAAEILGLSPYWQRRPRLQKIRVVYEAPPSGATSSAWASIQRYFSEYFESIQSALPAGVRSGMGLEFCPVSGPVLFAQRFQECLADSSLVDLVVVYSSRAEELLFEKSHEPANPGLRVHRIACEDAVHPTSASTRRQLYSSLLAHRLSASMGYGSGAGDPSQTSGLSQ
jgi:hypothetical protein